MRDLRAQASWVTPAMSWPSIRMRPSSRSKNRSSRLTSVDLPAPERPTSPIFSPGATVRVRPSMHAGLAAVAEAHVVEEDLAAGTWQARARRLRSASVIGRAIVCMPSCTTPMFSKMSVTCQATQPAMLTICQASGSAVATMPTLTWPRRPQQQREAAGAGHQQRVERRRASKPNSVLSRSDSWNWRGVLVDRLAHIGVLVARAREQLHGQDVGVAVDDPPGQHGARSRSCPWSGRACAARRRAASRCSRRTTAPSAARATDRRAPSRMSAPVP